MQCLVWTPLQLWIYIAIPIPTLPRHSHKSTETVATQSVVGILICTHFSLRPRISPLRPIRFYWFTNSSESPKYSKHSHTQIRNTILVIIENIRPFVCVCVRCVYISPNLSKIEHKSLSKNRRRYTRFSANAKQTARGEVAHILAHHLPSIAAHCGTLNHL